MTCARTVVTWVMEIVGRPRLRLTVDPTGIRDVVRVSGSDCGPPQKKEAR